MIRVNTHPVEEDRVRKLHLWMAMPEAQLLRDIVLADQALHQASASEAARITFKSAPESKSNKEVASLEAAAACEVFLSIFDQIQSKESLSTVSLQYERDR